MTRLRIAPRAQPNPGITALARASGDGNRAWLASALAALGPGLHVVLLGGTGMIDFRLRVAQSQLRADMLPSYWSHAFALLASDGALDSASAWQVNLWGHARLDLVPGSNAIQAASIAEYDDPQRYPNIALLKFPAPPSAPAVTKEAVAATIHDLKKARLSEDLVTPLVRWLGFVWGVEEAANPLVQGVPMPSARLTEVLFSALGIDINPGTAGHFTCPEAIWNAALWWSDYYGGVTRCAGDPAASAPEGRYVREANITLIDRE